MRHAFRLLLQSLVVLCFIASTGLTAAAGLGPAGWQDAQAAAQTLAKDLASHHSDAKQHAADRVERKHLNAKPCSKFERPAPTKHQCHRATSQAPVSSRPRPQGNGPDDVAGLVGYAGWHTPWTVDAGPETAAQVAIVRATRRSAFWQVFAYAGRLRR